MSPHSRGRGDRNIWPLMTSIDALALRDWLAQLGFEKGPLIHKDGRVDHSEMIWPGGGRVIVCTQREEDPSMVPAGIGNVYIVTDDPDEVYRTAREMEATISRELMDTDYGSREFTVRSPDGHSLTFGTYGGAEKSN